MLFIEVEQTQRVKDEPWSDERCEYSPGGDPGSLIAYLQSRIKKDEGTLRRSYGRWLEV